MKVSMSRITIYGVRNKRKAILEFLQRQQNVDVSAYDEEAEEFGFLKMDTGEYQSEFMRKKTAGEKALEIMEQYIPEKNGMFSSLNGRRELTAEEYYTFTDDIPEMLNIANKISELSEKISERKGRIARCNAVIEELQPWTMLDVPLDYKGSAHSVCMTGTFPREMSEDEIISEYYSECDVSAVSVEVISTMPQQTCVFIICGRKHKDLCEKRLRDMGFSSLKNTYKGTAAEGIERQKQMIAAMEKENTALADEIKSYRGARNALKFMVDYHAMRTEKYEVISKLSQRNSVFVISGYTPEAEAGRLKAVLEHKYGAAVEIEDGGEDAPVLLKNKRLAEPVEGVVKTFSMPSHREIDPTSIMAFFYYAFFGLMLSDAAYGFIITLGCAIAILKYKNMEPSMKETLRMFMYCGISTMFWGVMFGSYFGDAVSVIAETFFNKTVTIEPLWFEPVDDPMRMLMFSFAFGIVHLFTGLGIKLYQCVKAKDYISMFTDCIFWYMLVGGGIVYLFRVDMFLSMAGLNVKLPAVYANAAAVIAAAGAIGILIFSARSGSVLKRLAKGAYSLYGVTSWLSDILSYSRLLALGLATGVIATVFNKMGSMFGGGVSGALIFLIVFVIGHSLNIGVNLLGAYVHTNRLQFVEFFGKFFDGGGVEFEPFAAHTKYYKFKEE